MSKARSSGGSGARETGVEKESTTFERFSFLFTINTIFPSACWEGGEAGGGEGKRKKYNHFFVGGRERRQPKAES